MRHIMSVLVGVALISTSSYSQFTPTKGKNAWSPDTSSMKVVYWSQWLDNLKYDTLALRPHQYFTDSLEGGRFTVTFDTVTGRGSLMRSNFSTLWVKDTLSRRDTFSLPIFPYGSDIVKYPSDSLRVAGTHTFVMAGGSEQTRIEPVTITGFGTTLQVRIRYAKSAITDSPVTPQPLSAMRVISSPWEPELWTDTRRMKDQATKNRVSK
jgi:hypothetical protein